MVAVISSRSARRQTLSRLSILGRGVSFAAHFATASRTRQPQIALALRITLCARCRRIVGAQWFWDRILGAEVISPTLELRPVLTAENRHCLPSGRRPHQQSNCRFPRPAFGFPRCSRRAVHLPIGVRIRARSWGAKGNFHLAPAYFMKGVKKDFATDGTEQQELRAIG